MTQQLVDLKNVRSGKQQAKYELSLKNGVCMFCRENIDCYLDGSLLFELDHWYVIDNGYPYEHTKHHFLINSQKHLTDLSQVSPEAMAELLVIWKMLCERYDIPGGALFWRFGDSRYNASSIAHLHAHIIVPDLSGSVKATIAKDYSWRSRAKRQLRKWWWHWTK